MLTPEVTKASFPPTGEVRPESGPTGQRARAPLLMGRVGRAPCQNRHAGLDIVIISGKLKLQPCGSAAYLGNVGLAESRLLSGVSM